MTNQLSCYHCSKATQVSALKPLGFRESCSGCNRDLHVCRNCELYDEGAHHECRESSAEWVRDKERANRCEHFVPRTGLAASPAKTPDALAALEALFKK